MSSLVLLERSMTPGYSDYLPYQEKSLKYVVQDIIS
nr:unnamed protein product [Callosobruchus analis]